MTEPQLHIDIIRKRLPLVFQMAKFCWLRTRFLPFRPMLELQSEVETLTLDDANLRLTELINAFCPAFAMRRLSSATRKSMLKDVQRQAGLNRPLVHVSFSEKALRALVRSGRAHGVDVSFHRFQIPELARYIEDEALHQLSCSMRRRRS